ncbi:MAG TPA: replication-associated recombination protein A [Burkholderiales bacterium]|nr:replication-associated recombination protein A [Burkholderiales bacterium]
MADLFSEKPQSPLAERLRPDSLETVVGQSHLLGPGRALRLAFESGKPHSMILWGPPGVGKTTLARLMANSFNAEFIALSAVFAGVKDIREAIQRAQSNLSMHARHTLLFVDEVHRFNKAQQDAFLPYVEQGLITFIGATTENPSFEVNSALLSRAQVYVLKPLDERELGILLERAVSRLDPGIQVSPEAASRIVDYADGDARRLLNLLEQAHTAAVTHSEPLIDLPLVVQALERGGRMFDKGGDAFYDMISALHKSVRGSNPDASLYWMARMLDGGADPLYVGRRLVRMATEDIGLADPRALGLTLDACLAYERLGSPEGELALAQAVLYLACAPKSNAVYKAWKAVNSWVESDHSRPVPEHLRNAPTKLMQDLGYGKTYRYAHDEPEAYAAGENYFPQGIKKVFYEPTDRGLEARIKERLAYFAKLDAEATGRHGKG